MSAESGRQEVVAVDQGVDPAHFVPEDYVLDPQPLKVAADQHVDDLLLEQPGGAPRAVLGLQELSNDVWLVLARGRHHVHPLVHLGVIERVADAP